MLAVPELGSLRQGDYECEVSLGYIVNSKLALAKQ